MAQGYSAALCHVFRNAIKGCSSRVLAGVMEKMVASPNIAYVEKNAIVWAAVMPEDIATLANANAR